MPFADVNGLEFCYETAGSPSHPPILLIAGLGVQLIDWADHVVAPLVDAGHYVILFDNRDIGLSTTFDGAPSDPQALLEALMRGEQPEIAYTVADMAADTAGLLDALGLASAHLVGVSMGGMIAQATAIWHGHKVRSLTSIMSTTGAPDVGQPTPEALTALLAPAASDDREARIAQGIAAARVWASPGHFDEEAMRGLFEAAWDRVGGPQQANAGRHFCAIVASPPRDELLGGLSVPALVVHGSADPLIAPSGGQRTAAAIPGAELLLVEGMGHDLVPAFAPRVLQAISDLVATVEHA